MTIKRIKELDPDAPLWIKETYIDETKDAMYGETEPYESCATAKDAGRLFRDLQREYGRCRSKVYVDTVDGSVPIGWVFEKRVRYTDSPKTYVRAVWVEVCSEPDTHTIERHIVAIG